MTEFEVRELDPEIAKQLEEIAYDTLTMISDRVPKGRFNWDINMVLNVLNACMVIFMQKVVEPENFHEFCEQITYHLRRNADHIINQMKLKERDASQSTDHNTASDT